jgi:hypothetical protein
MAGVSERDQGGPDLIEGLDGFRCWRSRGTAARVLGDP